MLAQIALAILIIQVIKLTLVLHNRYRAYAKKVGTKTKRNRQNSYSRRQPIESRNQRPLVRQIPTTIHD